MVADGGITKVSSLAIPKECINKNKMNR